MKLNTEKITRKSQYWHNINSLATEAFPPLSARKHILFGAFISAYSVCSDCRSGITCGQKTTSQSLNFFQHWWLFFLFISKIDPQQTKKKCFFIVTCTQTAIKIGACNIYHGCVHNMLVDKSDDILRGLYKSASFVVQAIAFKRTAKYIKHQSELRNIVSNDERVIVDTFLNLKNGGMVDFNLMSETLFDWSKKWIADNN